MIIIWFLSLVVNWVVVSNIFYFHLYLGKWSNLTNVFQMGWNHQPVIYDHIWPILESAVGTAWWFRFFSTLQVQRAAAGLETDALWQQGTSTGMTGNGHPNEQFWPDDSFGWYFTGWWFQTFFIFTPNPGKMIPFDEHIFQMGWFNHHLVYHCYTCCFTTPALQRLRRAAKDLRPEVSLKGKDFLRIRFCYLTSGEVGGFSPKLKDILRKKSVPLIWGFATDFEGSRR